MKRLLATPLAILGLTLLVIVSCSPLAPRDQGRSFMFTLAPVATSSATKVKSTLIVDHPTARIELDTYRVALIRPDGAFDYFARTRWVDFISPMVLDTLALSMEDAGIFTSVHTESTAFSGDYVLKSEIREFNAVYKATNQPPEIHITFSHILLKGDRKTRVASFTARGKATAADNALEAIHKAFNAAYTASQKSTARQIAKAIADEQAAATDKAE